jgi:uncharacterized membrane protein
MRIAESDIRRVFQVSLWLKGLHSLAEVLGGLSSFAKLSALGKGSTPVPTPPALNRRYSAAG